MNNFQIAAHIDSLVPWNSRAVHPSSLGTSPGRYSDNNYSLYNTGHAVVTSPSVRPNGRIYLAPVPSNPKHQVDVWIQSHPWHSRPLVQVVQAAGSFSQSFDEAAAMPLNGWINLDMYMNTLTQTCKNTYNAYWWY